MDWIVFGDDWGRHPSTTQHLVRNLPVSDRIVWVDSLGMRAPRLSIADARRVLARARGAVQPEEPASARRVQRVRPPVLPWHTQAPVRALNREALAVALRSACGRAGVLRPVVLAANPVAAYYADLVPYAALAYLKLDEYARLPGVDPKLAQEAEAAMHARADLLLTSARTLIPADRALAARYQYLPQGVDHAHFAVAARSLPATRVLGFFGLLAEWIDFELIEAVARARPQWTLELRGPVRVLPEQLRQLPNIKILPPVPYADLPAAISHWRAAWMPFRVNELTRGVNPLKAREYLAAGLPTFGTDLPELRDMHDVCIGQGAESVLRWLDDEASCDDLVLRRVRSARVENEDWSARAQQLRQLALRAARGCSEMDRVATARFELKRGMGA